jgi:hypothetical protein
MADMTVSVFLIPKEWSSLPNMAFDEADMEKDSGYPRILEKISKAAQEATVRKRTKCDVSIEVERQKITALTRLLEKKGHKVFVQGVLNL